MLAHSFNRVYAVTNFILLPNKDLKFSKFNYDSTCAYFAREKMEALLKLRNTF